MALTLSPATARLPGTQSVFLAPFSLDQKSKNKPRVHPHLKPAVSADATRDSRFDGAKRRRHILADHDRNRRVCDIVDEEKAETGRIRANTTPGNSDVFPFVMGRAVDRFDQPNGGNDPHRESEEEN